MGTSLVLYLPRESYAGVTRPFSCVERVWFVRLPTYIATRLVLKFIGTTKRVECDPTMRNNTCKHGNMF